MFIDPSNINCMISKNEQNLVFSNLECNSRANCRFTCRFTYKEAYFVALMSTGTRYLTIAITVGKWYASKISVQKPIECIISDTKEIRLTWLVTIKVETENTGLKVVKKFPLAGHCKVHF